MRHLFDHVWVRFALVTATALVLQLTLMPRLQVGHISGDLMALMALSAALVMGPERGAVGAFMCGMVFDLALQTPFGLSALVYVLVANGLGQIRQSLSLAGWRTTALSLGLATAAVAVGYSGLAVVFGGPWLGTGQVVRIAAVEAAFSALLGPLAVRVTRWTAADTRLPVALS